MGAVGVLGETGYHEDKKQTTLLSKESVLQYFCFPTVGVSVAMRNGDILLFNPLIPHCISSRATQKEKVICTSLYLKTALVGGNDNDKTVQDLPTPN
jgi:hypothetical protein